MGKTPGSGRQVMIISEEFIAQIEHHLNLSDIDPGTLRRNLAKGLNLTYRRQRFRIGGALFEATQLWSSLRAHGRKPWQGWCGSDAGLRWTMRKNLGER